MLLTLVSMRTTKHSQQCTSMMIMWFNEAIKIDVSFTRTPPTHCLRRQASVYQIADHLSERNRRLRRLKLHVPVCNIIMFVRFVLQQCMWSWYHSISLMYKYTNHCNSLPGLKSKDMLGYVCPKGCWLIDLRKKNLMFYHKNMIVDSYLILIIYS